MPIFEFSVPEDAVIVADVGAPAPILGGESAAPGGWPHMRSPNAGGRR